jgi:MFS family permease
VTTGTAGLEPTGGALGPLRVAVFRALWLAVLVSNVGSWMQTVGAQWLLVDEHASPAVVALVQTASSVPVLLLGIPAGVLAEFVDRRRLLIAVQACQVVAGVVLTVLTAVGAMTPALLLVMTFIVGAASAVQLPAYQALVPETVPRRMIRDAAALSSIGVNIARAVGPAVAGLVIARAGVPFVFGANVVSFLVFLVVLVGWRGYEPPVVHAEPFLDATRAGLRYVRNSVVMRQVLLQLALVMVPANALWALLPLVASGHLHLSANGYGLLLAALGAGSVGGAFLMPSVRGVLGTSHIVLVASAVFGLTMVAVVLVTTLWVVLPLLVLAGIAWIGVVTTLNGTTQAFLPVWVRARGLSVYQLVLFGSTAVGSALAGAVASWVGVTTVMWAAGALTVLTGVRLLLRPLPRTDQDRSAASMPLTDLPPVLADTDDPAADRRTVVLVRYTVAAGEVAAFVPVMDLLGRSRRRTGATTWGLFEDPTAPGTYTETFTVRSWREHVDQHEARLTGHDRSLLDRAHAFSDPPPVVEHLLAVDVRHHAAVVRPARGSAAGSPSAPDPS